MWNRGIGILWVSIKIQRGKNLRLSFPISLKVLMELLDCASDMMALICTVTPKMPASGSHISTHGAKELIQMLMVLLGSITKDGPYDLIDVSADQVSVSIRVK